MGDLGLIRSCLPANKVFNEVSFGLSVEELENKLPRGIIKKIILISRQDSEHLNLDYRVKNAL